VSEPLRRAERIPARAPLLVIGCSDGIGRQVALALLERGDRVIGVSRRDARIDDARYEHHTVDVAAAEYPELLRGVLAQCPDLAAAIHCAAVGSDFDPADLTGELRCFRTNLLSAVETAAVLVPHWRGRGIAGHLVVLSSLADLVVVPGAPSYAASKAGLSRWLRGLGIALRRERIAVTNIRFGFVDTKLAVAPWRPFLISRERAARIVLAALRTRRAVVSRPRRALWVATAAGALQRLALALEGAFRSGPR